jgi:hypothetical protein
MCERAFDTIAITAMINTTTASSHKIWDVSDFCSFFMPVLYSDWRLLARTIHDEEPSHAL